MMVDLYIERQAGVEYETEKEFEPKPPNHPSFKLPTLNIVATMTTNQCRSSRLNPKDNPKDKTDTKQPEADSAVAVSSQELTKHPRDHTTSIPKASKAKKKNKNHQRYSPKDYVFLPLIFLVLIGATGWQ